MVWTSRPRPASTFRRAGVAVAALGLATACGTGSAPGVRMIDAQSDVAFGGGSTPSPAVTAGNPVGPIPGGPIGVPGGPILPPLDFGNPPPGAFPSTNPGPVRSDICPGPAPYSTAAEPATTYVQGKPKPGFYFWQEIKSDQKAAKVVITTAKYTNNEIKNVSETKSEPNPSGDPTTTFTFDRVAPIAGGHKITYTYQVKQNAPGTEVGEVLPVGKPQRVAVPDAGISLKAAVEIDDAGKVVSQFHPSVPVLLLQLPIKGGATFSGAGSDPSNGASMQVQGTIVGPDRVTACRDYIQGIRVDLSTTSSGVPGQAAATVKQALIFETQAGGLLIGNAQTPQDSPITYRSNAGDRLPTTKPRTIPKEQAL